MSEIETHDLGHGWFANFVRGDERVALTIRNPDKGQRIDLSPASYATLRGIFLHADPMAEDNASEEGCTHPNGHEWSYTGSAYGGDDDSYHGEGRCYCLHCGADGDA